MNRTEVDLAMMMVAYVFELHICLPLQHSIIWKF